jgi:hypothetical protein
MRKYIGGSFCRIVAFVGAFLIASGELPSVGARAADAGQGTTLPAALTAYTARDDYRKAIVDSAKELEGRLPNACAGMTYTVSGDIRFHTSTEFDAQGEPIKGLWVEIVNGTGCGQTVRFNILTIARPDQPPRSISMLIGDTHADPTLQRDAIPYALQAAHRLAPDCHQVGVVDTRFDAFEGDAVSKAKNGPARPWREVWTVWECGTFVEVPIHFAPDETGTGIRTVSTEVRLKH